MLFVDWIVLVAWAVTLVGTIVNLFTARRLRPGAPVDGPLVSVIIPARNEEANIERTVRGFFVQTYANLEIVVVDDRSTDGTKAILDRLAAEDRRLRVIPGAELPPGWLGKSWALHEGSRHAAGEILLFVDADILYSPPAVAAAVADLRSSRAAMIALMPRFEMHGFWENVALPQLALTVFSLLPMWMSNRSRIAVFALGAGSGNVIWRDDYAAIGGHEALKDAVVDDVALARLARRRGRRTEAVRADDLISVRIYRGGREIIHGFSKNFFAVLGQSYLMTIFMALMGLLFHIYPFVRALAGDVLNVWTVALITLTRLILFHSLQYSLPYALFAHPLMVLFWIWISIRSAWLTGVRKQLAWRGRVYDARQSRFGA